MNKQKIKMSNKVLYKNKNIEVRGDIIVPDIKPDILNIINTNRKCIHIQDGCKYKQNKTRWQFRYEYNIFG